MAPKAPKSLLTKASSVLGFAIGIAGVAFVVRTLVDQWPQVTDAFSKMDVLALLTSALLALLALIIIGSTWSLILRKKHHQLKTTTALSWYFTGQLGKYVPGGVWAVVGRAEMAVRGGIPRTDAYVSTGVSMMTTYIASVVVIALGSILSWTEPLIGISLAIALIVGFILYWLPVTHRLVLKVSTRVLPKGIAMAPANELLRYTLILVPAWILMSLSTSVTAAAFGAEVSIAQMLFFTASSWLVGFLAIGVPGGIGVRESVFTALATPTLGAPLAISIALASRFVFVVADLVGALASNAVVRMSRQRKLL